MKKDTKVVLSIVEFLLIVGLLSAISFTAGPVALSAESGEGEGAGDKITLTTYYPAPFGVYKTLRLHPTDTIDPTVVCSNAGEMYYDDSDNEMYICNGVKWQPALPRGIIVMWSGTLADVPDDWALCDGGTYTAPNGGSVSTPNLTERFIYGVSSDEDPGTHGGNLTHEHEVGIYRLSSLNGNGMATDWDWEFWASSDINPASGNERYYEYFSAGTRDQIMQTSPSKAEGAFPPYYELAFIMKL